MDLINRLDKKRIEKISEVIKNLISETDQLPFILLHQVRARLFEYDINWQDMQLAFNYLEEQSVIFPEQNFSRSIIKRAYKI